jgi:hypothetical protein
MCFLVSRMIAECRKEKGLGFTKPGKLGRPNGTGQRLLTNNPRTHGAYAWLDVSWGPINAEACPHAQQYDLVCNVVNISDVYNQYGLFWQYGGDSATTAKPISQSLFKQVWELWKKDRRVRERHKKNVSGKCDGKLYFICITL